MITTTRSLMDGVHSKALELVRGVTSRNLFHIVVIFQFIFDSGCKTPRDETRRHNLMNPTPPHAAALRQSGWLWECVTEFPETTPARALTSPCETQTADSAASVQHSSSSSSSNVSELCLKPSVLQPGCATRLLPPVTGPDLLHTRRPWGPRIPQQAGATNQPRRPVVVVVPSLPPLSISMKFPPAESTWLQARWALCCVLHSSCTRHTGDFQPPN